MQNPIDKIYSFLTGRNFLLTLIGFFVLVFLYSLIDRFIYIDDAWFGEQAFWFSKLGYVKTSSIIDYKGWEERLFVYHKLNIIIGAGLISVFGWSPASLRLFGLIVFIAFIIVIIRPNNLKKMGLAGEGVLFLFFLIVNPMTVLYTYTFRPEIPMLVLGCFSYLLLRSERRNSNVIWAGVLAGTTMLVHLNGFMFMAAGFGLLALRREFKAALIFGLSAGFIGLLYFYDLWQTGHFDTFLLQIENWPDQITTNYASKEWYGFLYKALLKLSNEHQRFFWSPDVWGLSALFVLSLITKGKALWRKHKDLIIYLIIADVSLNVFGSHIAEVYMLLLLPFLAMVVSSYISVLRPIESNGLKPIVMLLLVFQLLTVANMFVEILSQKENTVSISEEILSDFPAPENKVLVPYRFVFNELPNKQLVSFKTMEYHQSDFGSKYSKDEFVSLALKLGIQHMVISPEMYRQQPHPMYPWMVEEFRDIEGEERFLKLSVDPISGTLEIIE